MAQRDNYQLLLDVQQSLNRLEDKIDKKLITIEQRVSVLERFRFYLLGVVAVLIFGAEYAIKKILGQQ